MIKKAISVDKAKKRGEGARHRQYDEYNQLDPRHTFFQNSMIDRARIPDYAPANLEPTKHGAPQLSH